MAQKGEDIKGKDVFRALIDLVILVLLVSGAGFGGYFWGMHERLAPVKDVPPGTPGALPPSVVTPLPPASTTTSTATTGTPATTTGSGDTTSTSTTTSAAEMPSAIKKGKRKYWIASSGTDYTGYSIVVNVNGNPVDSFFGPGKSVDVSRFVKVGDNEIKFEAKALGAKYNKHSGDESAKLKVQLVTGPQIQEDFKPSAVIVSFERNASETEDYDETLEFPVKSE